MESMLAERLISLSWRLKRADLIQNQTFDAMHEQNTTNPLAKLAKSFGLKGLGTPQPEPTGSNPDLTLGRIALKDFANARVLDRLLMYERRIENSLHKTIIELQRLTLIRNLTPTNQPSNSPRPIPQQARSVSAGAPTKPRSSQTPNHPRLPLIRPWRMPEVTKDQNKTPEPKHPILTHNNDPSAQNKPNSQNPKTNATSYATKSYANIPLRSARKNKPKQTQSEPVPIHREHAGKLFTILERGGNPDLSGEAKPRSRSIGTQLITAQPLAKPDQTQFYPLGTPRSSGNKFLAIAPGTAHNAWHTVEKDHKP